MKNKGKKGPTMYKQYIKSDHFQSVIKSYAMITEHLNRAQMF